MDVTGRLTFLAGPGEAHLIQAAVAAVDLGDEAYEHRRLELKGRSQPIDVSVPRIEAL